MKSIKKALSVLLVAVLLWPAPALAAGSDPVPSADPPQSAAGRSGEKDTLPGDASSQPWWDASGSEVIVDQGQSGGQPGSDGQTGGQTGSSVMAEESLPAGTGVGVDTIPQPNFTVPCRAALLLEQDTGTVLFAQNADEPCAIASITKIMTLLLVFEALEEGKIAWQDIVPISEHAYSMGGSQIWLEPGEQFTVEQLMKAVIISSANDAAVALAEYVEGSEPVFCDKMNRKAQALGMENSHFLNACGLDAVGHLSTARDVALMSRELLCAHPGVKDYTGVWMDYLRGGETQLLNTNKLLKSYSGTTGLKTGTTGKAGVCISASATRNGTSLIAVVLGAASSEERFAAAKTLLDYGFSNYEVRPFPEIPGAPAVLPVSRGVEKQVEILCHVPDSILLQKGQGGTLTAQAELPKRLTAPVREGESIGTVTLKSGEEVIGTYTVTAAREICKMDMKAALALLTKALFAM